MTLTEGVFMEQEVRDMRTSTCLTGHLIQGECRARNVLHLEKDSRNVFKNPTLYLNVNIQLENTLKNTGCCSSQNDLSFCIKVISERGKGIAICMT